MQPSMIPAVATGGPYPGRLTAGQCRPGFPRTRREGDVGRVLGFIDGEPSDRWVQHAIQTPGYFLGLPTGQAAGAGQFLWDVWHGTENPQGAGDWMRGVMYGPTPAAGR